MTAAMRTLDDILAEPEQRSGVLAVLDAADAARTKLEAAQYRASFAPPPVYYAQCPCGSVFEIRPGDPNCEITADDYEAIRDWDDAHMDCGDDL